MSRSEPPAPQRKDRLEFPKDHVVCRSTAMTRLYENLAFASRGDGSVLITGETGSGKEQIARSLHLSSSRCDGPFEAVDCPGLSKDLSSAELFGVAGGAATGVRARSGRIQRADGGTLFLDEIGDLPVEQQVKLLRVLQEKIVHPVGGDNAIPVDVRVLAATNADLLEKIAAGSFREDLYHRLAGYIIHVPPLRERRQDIPVLAHRVVRTSAESTNVFVRGITKRAMERLLARTWQGNVRELVNVLNRAVLACPDGESIDSEIVGAAFGEGRHLIAPDLLDRDSLDLDENKAELERRLALTALDRTRYNKTQSARLLGISLNGFLKLLERRGLDG